MARGKKETKKADQPSPPEVTADVRRLQRQAEDTMSGMRYKAEQASKSARSKKRSKRRQ